MNAEIKIAPELRADPRPQSAVSTGVGLAGLAGLIAWTAVSLFYRFDGWAASLCGLLACAVPMIAWSLLVDKVHRSPSTGIDWDGAARPLRGTIDMTLAKITGLWAIWGAIGCFYCLARWYWDGNYLFSMRLLGIAAVPLALLSIPYLLWLDRRAIEPRDGAWHFGQLIAGRSELVDREILYDFFRSWAIKGFFLAFMLSIVPGNWGDAIRPAAWEILSDPVALARWLIGIMFMIDVTFATVGYMLTMKPLDAHIRSANPHAAGWMAALICYPPFIMMSPGGPLDYHQGTGDWTQWLAGAPVAMALMAAALVFLSGVYALATVAFGIRFSNLTHRGVLTHGPFAWTKHPAYVSKNLFWWLATMPFFATSGSAVDMIRNTALLALVSCVYYWRAKTEEKHLGADPAYRAYAEWMDRHGPIPRLVNWLFGRRPRAAEPVPAE